MLRVLRRKLASYSTLQEFIEMELTDSDKNLDFELSVYDCLDTQAAQMHAEHAVSFTTKKTKFFHAEVRSVFSGEVKPEPIEDGKFEFISKAHHVLLLRDSQTLTEFATALHARSQTKDTPSCCVGAHIVGRLKADPPDTVWVESCSEHWKTWADKHGETCQHEPRRA